MKPLYIIKLLYITRIIRAYSYEYENEVENFTSETWRDRVCAKCGRRGSDQNLFNMKIDERGVRSRYNESEF